MNKVEVFDPRCAAQRACAARVSIRRWPVFRPISIGWRTRESQSSATTSPAAAGFRRQRSRQDGPQAYGNECLPLILLNVRRQ